MMRTLRLRGPGNRLLLPVLLLLLANTPSRAALPPVPDSLKALVRAAPAGSVARGRALLRVAAAYRAAADSTGVFAYAALASTEARARLDGETQARALTVRAEYLCQADELQRALPLLQRAERLLGPRGASDARAAVNYFQGWANAGLGRKAEAFSHYRRAYQLYGRVQDRHQQAEILSAVGVWYLGEGLLDSAAAYLYPALRLHRRLHSRPEYESTVLSNLATLYHLQHREAPAAAFTRQALALDGTTGDSVAYVQTLDNLASIVAARDSVPAALRLYRRALGLYRRLGLTGRLAISYTKLADGYVRLAVSDSVERYYTLAIRQLLTQGSAPADVARPMASLAQFYLTQDRLTEARHWAEQALSRADTTRAAGLAKPLRTLHLVAARQADYRTAYTYALREQRARLAAAAAEASQLSEDLRARYGTTEAEAQLRRLQAARQAEAHRYRRQTQGLGATTGLLALLLVGGAWWRRRRTRRGR